jgi:hypothetical protein
VDCFGKTHAPLVTWATLAEQVLQSVAEWQTTRCGGCKHAGFIQADVGYTREGIPVQYYGVVESVATSSTSIARERSLTGGALFFGNSLELKVEGGEIKERAFTEGLESIGGVVDDSRIHDVVRCSVLLRMVPLRLHCFGK